MGQLKLNGLGVVLVESNSVARVGTYFVQHIYPEVGLGKLEEFQKQIRVIRVGKWHLRGR